MKQIRRKVGRWLVWLGIIGVLALAVTVFWLRRRDPYAFLNRFHPKRIEVDLRRILPKDWKLDPVVGNPRMTMLVFPYKEAPAVLAAMRSELTVSRGFTSRNMAPKPHSVDPPYDKDIVWQFSLRSGKPDDPDGANFTAGLAAASAERLYEGKGMFGHAGKDKPTCLVLISPAERG